MPPRGGRGKKGEVEGARNAADAAGGKRRRGSAKKGDVKRRREDAAVPKDALATGGGDWATPRRTGWHCPRQCRPQPVQRVASEGQ